MTRVLAIAALVFLAGGSPGVAQSPPDLVKNAIAAAGGEQALRSLKTLQIAMDAKHWEPDQSLVPGGPPYFLGDSKINLTWDLASNSVRGVWERAMIGQGKHAYQEIVTPAYGFVTDGTGSRPMSAIRVAAQLRELRRVAPDLLIRMRDNAANTAFEGGTRTAEGIQPAMSFKDGGTTFIVTFNKKTQFPSFVRTQDDDSVRGTVNYDVKLEEWKPVNGAMVAHLMTYLINDVPIARIRYTSVTANAPIDPSTFAPPADIKAALKSPATGNVPYQWVLRRIAVGRFLDSDQVIVPPGGALKLVELAPNVQHVVGGSHNGLIVDLKDGLVVFEAPINDEQSRWTIDAARAKYGKPVKQLVLTHHHSDFSGGVRTYMGESVNILVPAPDKRFFVKLALAERMVPDELQKKRISPNIDEIKDKMTVGDGTTQITLMRIPNHHADGMLIAHIMPANLIWVTDLWSPGTETEKTAGALALSDALKRANITGATIAGGHGATAPQSALEQIVTGKPTQ